MAIENPVSRTAYYCAGTRMLDAGRPDSLLHDTLAEPFMGDEGKATFAAFRHLAVPIGAHQVRCYLIDELVRERLAANPESLVVLVGAGFDSRAFRLKAGRWLEIDDRAVIERKDAVAPAEQCPNRLTRLSIDFTRDSLAATLAPFSTRQPVVVVCEGVTMYLEPDQVDSLAAALKSAFPHHWLFADVMTASFAMRYAGEMSEVLATLGTGFRGLEKVPLARWIHAGYRVTQAVSLIGRSIAMKRVPIPSLARHLLWALPTMRGGYRVVALEYGR